MSPAPPDPRAFRETMGLFATGVTVLAAGGEGRVHGMTANAVASVSLEPPLVLACVGKQSNMAELSEASAGFSLNILREDQRALSTYFAGAWREGVPPPFRFVDWEGGPRLEGCAAAIGCTTHARIEAGDHWILIGRVVAMHRGVEPRRPLIFFGGRYGRLDPRESLPAPDLEASHPPLQIFYDPWRED